MMPRFFFMAALLCAPVVSLSSAAEQSEWNAEKKPDRLIVSLGGKPVLEYVLDDPQIARPYYCRVHTATGKLVTRAHPPRDGQDPIDHADMHPGIWLAFGDLNGADFWRNKAKVKHARFIEEPVAEGTKLRFTVENRYLDGGKLFATERCQHTLSQQEAGYLIAYDSSLVGEDGLAFGDQEEMGLGVRVASPLRVKGGGGEIVDSEGRRNEPQVWGKSAPWCDYRGEIDGELVGLAVFSHPDNFRPSWLHVRDYGLLVANPFGRKALSGGEISRVEVPAKEPFRLRFAVLVHSSPGEPPDLAAAYREYGQLSK